MKSKKMLVGVTGLALVLTCSQALATTNFADVQSSNWYAPSVNEMVSSGIGFGTDGTHYSPNTAITRGEVAQMLYNALGKPEVVGDSGFTDVLGSPYVTAITYCKQQGFISGYPDGTFGPTKTITRQEAARMMWNIFQTSSAKFPKAILKTTVDNSEFRDTSSIASWGAEGVSELAHAGVIHGYPDGTFRPNGEITRAEFAQLLDGALHDVGFQFPATSVTSGGSSGTPTQSSQPPQPPTTSGSNLTTNSDGTQSPTNITIPRQVTNADEIKNLMGQVKFQANGSTVTVTVPDTKDAGIEWYVKAFTSQSSTVAYESSSAKTLTLPNVIAVAVMLQQPDNVGSAAYLGATYRNLNGQWVVQYH